MRKASFIIALMQVSCLFGLCLVFMHGTAAAQSSDAAPHLISLLPDFQINENTITSRHYHPKVVVLPNGEFVIAWIDERNDDIDVFLQKYDANGNLLGPNIRVNDDETDVLNLLAAIACDSSGRFIVVMADAREDDSFEFIYGQRFTVDGEKTGANFRMCDTKYEKRGASIAMREGGDFLVAWCDVGSKTARYRGFYANGEPMGPSLPVPNEERLDFNSMKCLLNEPHDYLLIWEFVGDTVPFLAGQRIDFDLMLKGSPFTISYYNSPASTIETALSDSVIMIVWASMSQGNGNDILARVFRSNSGILDAPFIVNSTHPGLRYFDPTVITIAQHKFLIHWQDARSGRTNIYCRIYNLKNGKLSPEFQPAYNPDSSTAGSAAVASNSAGNIVFSWEDDRNDEYEIYAQRYDKDIHKLGENFCVNDDQNSGRYFAPQIGKNGRGDVYVLWQSGLTQVYMRKIFSNGELGQIVEISKFMSPLENGVHARFDVGKEHIVIVWMTDSKLYAQRFTLSLQPCGDSSHLSGLKSYFARDCDVSINENDDFVIAWADRLDRRYIVSAQRFDKTGQPQGNKIRLDDDPAARGLTARMKDTRVKLDNDGSFVVAWLDRRISGIERTFFQIVGPKDSLIGGNAPVYDVRESYAYSIDMNDQGDFVVAWGDYTSGRSRYDVYARKYSSDGSPVSEPLQINSKEGYLDFRAKPQISMAADGAYAVCWQDDYFGDDDILMRLVDANGQMLGPVLRVNHDTQTATQSAPDVLFLNDKIWTVWEDSREEGAGRNIFASLSEFDYAYPLSVASRKINMPEFSVLSSYPNPFNESITIRFWVPHGGLVKADIYDLRGRLAAPLISNEFQAGSNTVIWSATNNNDYSMPSGVYFVRFQFENRILRQKIILLR